MSSSTDALVAKSGVVVVTHGPHDVSGSLQHVDPAILTAVDPCEASKDPDDCESEAEREAEGLSRGHDSDAPPVAFEAVPDGGAVEQISFGPRAPLAPVASFNTAFNSALDNNIGVGLSAIVAMINSRFKVMTKTGTTTFGPVNNNSIFSGFANGVCTNSGDGHIQYDQLAHRWLFTQPNFSSGYWICYAVSTTEDPTGPYYRYAFPRPLFPDYPRVAVWPDGYYTATSTGDTVIEKTVCVVDRAKMLVGQTATQQCVTVQNVSFMEPANVDGQTLPPPGAPALVFAAGGAQLHSVLQDDGIYVYKFHVDWNAPANTTFTGPTKITVAPYSFLCGGQLVSCVPQPGSTTRLDAQGDKIMHRAAYRNINAVESIVLQHSINTNVGGGGPRWYELRLDANRDPQLYQQSTYAPDARYRWMGSIGMDRKGNIAMGFSYGGGPYTLPMTTSSCVTPACDRVGVRFTARQAGDPLGVMTYADGVIVAGVGSSTGGNRWEDWSVLAIDPTDDCTFWYNGGYMPSGATSYNGRIGAWRLPNCRLDALGAAATPIPTGQFTGPVATFTDSDLTATSGVFTASIDWGDGASSAGTVTGSNGSFSVAGSHNYAGSGSRTIRTTITGSEGSTAAAESTVVVGNASYPTATILQPTTATAWSVGEQIAFSGTGMDKDGVALGAAAMSWSLVVHDCPSTCTESTLDTRVGVSAGSFTAPNRDYPSYLEVRLTVTDGGGLQTTASVAIQPRTVSLTFATSPAGLVLTVGGSTVTSPVSRTVIVGSANPVSVPSPQGSYQFASWTDGGAQSHTITAATAATFTASFTAPPVANVQVLNAQTALGNSSGTFIDLAYTVPLGQDLLLVVYGGAESTTTNAALPASATFNSRTLTQAGAIRTPATGTNNGSAIFWTSVQSGETGTIRLTFAGTCQERGVGAVTLAGASLGGPTVVRTSTGTTNLTDTITTTTPNAMVISAATQGNNGVLTATGTGHVRDVSVGLTSSRVAGGHVEVAAPAAFTLGYSGTINRIAMVLAAFAPGAPPGPDITPPTVSIGAPPAGTVSGTVNVTANASDNIGVASVRFQRDGTDIGVPDTVSPYQVAWDTTGVANGPYLLTAIAKDAAGNEKTSAALAVNVTNDLVAPSVNITAPGAGATVGATVNVAANASDDIGVTSVQFQLNGGNLGAADTVAPYEVAWNTTSQANGGPYSLTAIARDAAGRQTTSAVVNVNVFNAPPPPDTTGPTVSISSPTGGSVSGTITVTANAADSGGVASVQFKLNGANLGALDTSSLYSVSWNTTTSANGGPYALTAVATDTSGNATTSAVVTVTVSNVTPPTGLVAAYGFNENTGTTASDATGNGRTGTMTNATWTASGKVGSALSFNGTSALVTVADHASLDLTTGMTLEAWVYPTALGTSWRSAIMKENGSGLSYALYANENIARPSAYVRVGGSDQLAAGAAGLPLNAWSHLATTYDGTTLRIYVNGVQVGSRGLSGSIAVSTGALRIGGNQVWGEWFAGRIDEVRIYNRALSAAEIQTDMATPVN